MRNIRLVITK